MKPWSEGLATFLQTQEDAIVEADAIGGGCTASSQQVQTRRGQTLFVKFLSRAPDGFFLSERLSLEQLRRADSGLTIPAVVYQDEHCLALEYLRPSHAGPGYWGTLARGLAALHRHTQAHHGLERTTYCGATRLNNQPDQDGYQFFAERRLLEFMTQARRQGLFTRKDELRLETLCKDLKNRVPEQPASLLHGDLWSGNQYPGSEGRAVVIDPALYFGWRESDLAMTTLFGGFPNAFYVQYDEAYPMQPGWHERFPLYQLYPLLNHCLLFGASYVASVQRHLQSLLTSRHMP